MAAARKSFRCHVYKNGTDFQSQVKTEGKTSGTGTSKPY